MIASYQMCRVLETSANLATIVSEVEVVVIVEPRVHSFLLVA